MRTAYAPFSSALCRLERPHWPHRAPHSEHTRTLVSQASVAASWTLLEGPSMRRGRSGKLPVASSIALYDRVRVQHLMSSAMRGAIVRVMHGRSLARDAAGTAAGTRARTTWDAPAAGARARARAGARPASRPRPGRGAAAHGRTRPPAAAAAASATACAGSRTPGALTGAGIRWRLARSSVARPANRASPGGGSRTRASSM